MENKKVHLELSDPQTDQFTGGRAGTWFYVHIIMKKKKKSSLLELIFHRYNKEVLRRAELSYKLM